MMSCSLVDIYKFFKESTATSIMVCRAQRRMFYCNSITACQIALGHIECIVMNIFVLRKSKLRKVSEISRRTKHANTYAQRTGKFLQFFKNILHFIACYSTNILDWQTKKETNQLTNHLNHSLTPAISQAITDRFISPYVCVHIQNVTL